MTEKEKRLSDAMDAYEDTFGEGSYPGVDVLPKGYDDSITLAELLEKCVSERHTVDNYVQVRELIPGALY